jgi:hypothetical protein
MLGEKSAARKFCRDGGIRSKRRSDQCDGYQRRELGAELKRMGGWGRMGGDGILYYPILKPRKGDRWVGVWDIYVVYPYPTPSYLSQKHQPKLAY